MKKILYAITASCLYATGAQAMTHEEAAVLVANAGAEVQGIKTNPDGSVSFTEITVKKGDQTYSIAWELDGSSPNRVCKLLGFDQALDDKQDLNLNAVDYQAKKIRLDANGVFLQVRNDMPHKVVKVACYNERDLKIVVQFNKTMNPDSTAVITHLVMLRGDVVYSIAAELDGSSAAKVCNLLGYEHTIWGPDFNFTEVNYSAKKVRLTNEGEYFQTRNDMPHVVTKSTCYSGTEPSLVVYIGGDRYTRVIP